MESLTPGNKLRGAHVYGNPRKDRVKSWFFAFLIIDVAAIGVCAFILSQEGII